MHLRRTLGVALLSGAAAAGGLMVAGPAEATPAWTANCTALHQRFPHGVGKLHAHDHTSSTPVTDFRHSNRLYKKAMKFNRGLDRDHDKIACESD